MLPDLLSSCGIPCVLQCSRSTRFGRVDRRAGPAEVGGRLLGGRDVCGGSLLMVAGGGRSLHRVGAEVEKGVGRRSQSVVFFLSSPRSLGSEAPDNDKMAAALLRTDAAAQGIPLSALSPNFLHSNSTSHTWPFSAVAELIDNAYDPDVNAKQLWIDKTIIKERICLIFTDNGQGMNQGKLHKMLSFGFSEKVTINGHAPVGLYGNGFKSGSMRLGKDAIVFTKNGETCSIGFLSQTYLNAVKAENIIVPIISYSLNKKLLTEDMQLSLKAILSYSLFNTEKELLAELEAISGKKGTRIIIWNIRETKDGKPEFDFESDKYDIRIPEDILNDNTEKRKYKRQDRVDQFVPESDYSLRAYCSVLYLKPRMQIILLGRKVKTQLISKSLAHIEHDIYKPSFVRKGIKITFGFNWRNKEHYGIMMYHKNRLIKSYEKVGCQLRANDMGVGVIGVIECDFLKPTHNKQDFDYSSEYRRTIQALGLKLNDYWNEKNYSKQRDPVNVEDSQKLPDQVWAQCDGCLKWRKLPDEIDPDTLPDKWFCSMNQDRKYRNCSVPEEPEDSLEDTPSYQKTHKKQEQKNRGKTRQQFVDQSKQQNLQKMIQNYGREANALLKEQERLQAKLQLSGQKESPKATEVSSSMQKITKWVVDGDMTLSVSSGLENTSPTLASPVSNLQIVDVKSLSSPQMPTDVQSTKRKLTYDIATPCSKSPKMSDEKSLSMSLNGDAAHKIHFEDDLILLEEKSTPRPEENFDLSKVKKEVKESMDTSGFVIDTCGDNVLLRSKEGKSLSTQTENLNISVKEEVTASKDQSLSGSTTEERVQIQQLQCSTDAKEAIVKSSEQNLLKSMTEQRDSLKAKNELLEKELESLSKKLLEISGSHVKKELCHQSTQCELIIGDKTEHVKDFSTFNNDKKTIEYELALKEVEYLKQRCQALENLKHECAACNLKKEDDKQAQQLDNMLRQLDTCTFERDQLKDKADQLQTENDALKLNCTNLSKEVECLKQQVTEAQQSNFSDDSSMKLRALRIGVGQLLVNIVPELDLAQINYESTVVDEILDQVLTASTS
ncbi:MORC family CW-type zinc finger protein 3a [Pristis pectinata]|uniref:MORC family CW-type zinc finger protein 3a n=1 Tax=Pristis pectinata TaxID=685728 RepID=UPI00223E2914|nr:MORC family CW-type zinc finger protein 3a [Pristis pectinata]